MAKTSARHRISSTPGRHRSQLVHRLPSPTEIKATTPAHLGRHGRHHRRPPPAGNSEATASDHFTYAAPPTCASFTPTHGSTLGATTVELTGTNLLNATKVEFGTTEASKPFAENTATKIKLSSPAHAAGAVPIKVTTAGGAATCGGGEYTYEVIASVPTITSVSPTSGPTTGGQVVTVEGKTSAARPRSNSAPPPAPK